MNQNFNTLNIVLQILRWITFVPFAFLALIFFGDFILDAFIKQIGSEMAITLACILSSIIFLQVGIWVAPKKSKFVNYSLIIILGGYGILNMILSEPNNVSVILGICFTLMAILFFLKEWFNIILFPNQG